MGPGLCATVQRRSSEGSCEGWIAIAATRTAQQRLPRTAWCFVGRPSRRRSTRPCGTPWWTTRMTCALNTCPFWRLWRIGCPRPVRGRGLHDALWVARDQLCDGMEVKPHQHAERAVADHLAAAASPRVPGVRRRPAAGQSLRAGAGTPVGRAASRRDGSGGRRTRGCGCVGQARFGAAVRSRAVARRRSRLRTGLPVRRRTSQACTESSATTGLPIV